MSKEILAELRAEIDEVDAQLVALLARRKHLVSKVGETKLAHGLPVYVPQRESDLIKARRREAEAAGVSPDLIEDVLRRIMRESYRSEGKSGFKATAPELGPIVVIGGGAGMGALMVAMFRQSNYEVRILEQGSWQEANKILEGAGLVLVSVPISQTEAVIAQLEGLLPTSCILADVTSIKVLPLLKMLAVHRGPVVGLHPMFGPSAGSFAKQLVVYCHGRQPQSYEWLLAQIEIWGAGLLESEPEKHDHMMGSIQAMRHFATYVYGMHLYKEGISLETVEAYSSPIYRLELGMVGRLFAQEPGLYADIIFNSVEGREIAGRYQCRFEHELKLLQTGDRACFMARFQEVSNWFGPQARRFLQESSYMLDNVYDRYAPALED